MSDEQTKQERLKKLQEDRTELLKTFPEHCVGTREYIGIHHATPKHYEMLEDIEEEIKKLEAEIEAEGEQAT